MVRAYDPAFAYELAGVIRDGVERMYHDGEDVFYYVTVYNENYPQLPKPDGVDEGIIRGIYRLDAAPDVDDAKGRVRLVGSGSILQQVLAARDLLANELGIAAEVYSATSFQQLRHEAVQVERWNRLHPDKTPKVPYVGQVLGPDGGPIVVATDWVRTLPDLVAPWVPDPYIVLGHGRLRPERHPREPACALRDRPAAHRGRGPRRARPLRQHRRPPGGEVDPCAGRRSRDVRPADPLTRPTDAATAGSATTGALPEGVPERAPHGTAREVFAATLRLGLTSFGGPIAHLGYQRRAFVDERGWLDDAAFADLAALCQTLPGPASSQLTIAVGRLRAGWSGAFAAWLGFTLPSALIMIVLGLVAADAKVPATGPLAGAIHGLEVAAVAIVTQALVTMVRHARAGPGASPDRRRGDAHRPGRAIADSRR